MIIKKNNLLSLDQFIEESLYNKKLGYYMKKDPFGNKGDFITAPNISILFSEMIAIWVISFWESLKCPKKFNLIELGAGNGEMMRVMINTFKKFPKFKKACNINILEKSTLLKKLQNKNIKNKDINWLKDINRLNNFTSHTGDTHKQADRYTNTALKIGTIMNPIVPSSNTQLLQLNINSYMSGTSGLRSFSLFKELPRIFSY